MMIAKCTTKVNGVWFKAGEEIKFEEKTGADNTAPLFSEGLPLTETEETETKKPRRGRAKK